jgi:uncharacterized membrane protein
MVLATTGARRVPHDRSAQNGINIGRSERLLSVISGGALAAYALRRRDWRGTTLALLGAELLRRGATGHCNLYQALGVSTAGDAEYPARAPGEIVSDAATVDARKAIKIERTLTIARPRQELFAIWRNFERLPEFIPDLESVTSVGQGRSHWVAKLPGDKRVEWDSEIVNELPGQLIAWKTIGEPDVAHAGSVHFSDTADGRGTELRVVVDYEPPGGKLGAMIATFTRLFGQDPDAKIGEDLQRFKMTVEAGAPSTRR